MRLAIRLGMSLRRCMSEVSSSEFTLWKAFFFEELNNPDRTDHYLMQIAAEVSKKFADHPEKILLSHFRIPFTEDTEQQERRRLDAEERANRSKSAWLGWLGI